MRSWKFHLAAISVLSLTYLGGCTIHGDVEGPEPPDYVVVGPGYYYDDAYVDVYGHYHPRAYWYYSGHRWEHRDEVPHGYAIHRRVRREVHRQEHHEEHHEQHPNDHHDQH